MNQWYATYVGEYSSFLCSSKGLEWEQNETKTVDGETVMLLKGTFPDLFKFEPCADEPAGPARKRDTKEGGRGPRPEEPTLAAEGDEQAPACEPGATAIETKKVEEV